MFFLIVLLWFLTLSLLSFALMYLDKRAAQRRQWRVPEATLLIWALLGGGAGAKLGQRRFRHKTRKQPFGLMLNIALGVNLVTFVAFLSPSEMRQMALHVLRRLVE